jgi:hypothetical protein
MQFAKLNSDKFLFVVPKQTSQNKTDGNTSKSLQDASVLLARRKKGCILFYFY